VRIGYQLPPAGAYSTSQEASGDKAWSSEDEEDYYPDVMPSHGRRVCVQDASWRILHLGCQHITRPSFVDCFWHVLGLQAVPTQASPGRLLTKHDPEVASRRNAERVQEVCQ
jgi:hypothetical protein